MAGSEIVVQRKDFSRTRSLHRRARSVDTPTSQDDEFPPTPTPASLEAADREILEATSAWTWFGPPLIILTNIIPSLGVARLLSYSMNELASGTCFPHESFPAGIAGKALKKPPYGSS